MKAPIEKTTPDVSRTLRVLVADDHELVRRGLRTLLEAESGWGVCAEATTGAEAVDKVRQLQPDIVVLDIHMPGKDGLQAAREILATDPQPEVLILTLDESPEMMRSAYEVGVHGIVMKSDSASDLVAAVSALARHTPFYTQKASGIMMRSYALPFGAMQVGPNPSHVELTTRERDVAVLLAKGHSGKEIATALNISTKTVDSHHTNIMRKLGLQSKAELVRYAIRTGLVQA